MKRNVVLYILLVFLIVVNGFFLYNYIWHNASTDEKRPQPSNSFIAEQLGFTDAQLKAFEKKSKQHDNVVRDVSEDIKRLKEELFSKLSKAAINEKEVDSLTSVLGQKEKEKQALIFYYFKSIQEICDDTQKKRFMGLVKKALQNQKPENRQSPHSERDSENRRSPPRRD